MIGFYSKSNLLLYLLLLSLLLLLLLLLLSLSLLLLLFLLLLLLHLSGKLGETLKFTQFFKCVALFVGYRLLLG